MSGVHTQFMQSFYGKQTIPLLNFDCLVLCLKLARNFDFSRTSTNFLMLSSLAGEELQGLCESVC